jgi:hypothetical protein
MLTAIVHATTAPGALAVSLSALVPGVAEGLISNAVVVAPGPEAHVEAIADAMGAHLVLAAERPWVVAAQAARSPWLLLLNAGETPEASWIDAIERHVMQAGAYGLPPAFLPPAGLLRGLAARARLVVSPRRADAGWLVSRRALVEGEHLPAPVWLPAQRRIPVALKR